MDRSSSSVPDESGPAVVQVSAALHVERERQKAEIRRERDHLVLALAADTGTEGLARQLGLSGAVADTLLTRARQRLAAGGSLWAPGDIHARSLRPDGERWIDADSHFAELGQAAEGDGRFVRRPVA